MFSFSDLFQWERFVTPSIIKLFFWMTVAIIILYALSGVGQAFRLIVISPGAGILMLLAAIVGAIAGVIFARIVSEFILIVFRINEHLGALRSRGEI